MANEVVNLQDVEGNIQVVDIPSGGTGGVTASEARSNLGFILEGDVVVDTLEESIYYVKPGTTLHNDEIGYPIHTCTGSAMLLVKFLNDGNCYTLFEDTTTMDDEGISALGYKMYAFGKGTMDSSEAETNLLQKLEYTVITSW